VSSPSSCFGGESGSLTISPFFCTRKFTKVRGGGRKEGSNTPVLVA
jgi:hypothetical protein